MGDVGAGNDDRIADDLRLGVDELSVLAADGEAGQLAPLGDQAAAEMIEGEDRRSVLHLHALVDGTGILDLVAAGQCPGGDGQPVAHGLLLLGMDVGLFAHVGDHGGGRIGRVEHGHQLGLAKLGPGAVDGLLDDLPERGQLNDEEGEVTLAPVVAPALDHGGQERAVLVGPTGVALSLVPRGPANRIGLQGRDHGIVERARPLGMVRSHGGLGGTPRLLARLSRGGRLLLPLGQRDFVPLQGFRVSLDGLGVAVEDGLELRVGGQHGPAGPRFGRGSAVRRVDQADGNVELLLEVFAEEVAHAGEAGHGGGSTLGPGAVDVGLRLVGPFSGNGEEANLGIGRLGDHGFGVVAAIERHRHVRLPATDPDLADQDVVEDDCVFALDGQFGRSTRGERFERDAPLAAVGPSGDGLALEPDGHFLAFVGRTPNRHVHCLLEDRVVAEQRVGCNVRRGRQRPEADQDQAQPKKAFRLVHLHSPETRCMERGRPQSEPNCDVSGRGVQSPPRTSRAT